MTPAPPQSAAYRLVRQSSGQSLVEIAFMMPILVLLLAYVIDFGYFFIAAANITSAARNAAEYSVLGYQSPSGSTLPPAGPTTNNNTVAATALADLTSLLSSSTKTTVQVCSASNGMTGNLPNCTSYGPAGTSYTPIADPEAPTFILQRVDVTYTIQPPIPLTFFSVSFLPNLSFHRQVSMRAMD